MDWIWILPWLALVLVLVLIGATVWFRSRSISLMRILRAQLRETERDINHIQGLIQNEYSEQNPTPINEQITLLQQNLKKTSSDLQKQYQYYGEFHQTMKMIFPRNKIRLLQAPLDWYQLYVRANQLNRDHDQIEQAYQDAFRQMKNIRELAWTLGQRYREIYILHRDSSLEIEEILNHGVYGASLEKTIERVDKTERLVGEIPVYYLTEDKEELLRLADKDSITHVYLFLEENEAGIRKMFSQLVRWRDYLSRGFQQMGEIQKNVLDLKEQISHIPADLNLVSMEEKINQILADSDVLDKQLAHPEVESLAEIAKKSYRMMRMLQDMNGQIRDAINNLKSYGSLSKKLSAMLVRLEEETDKIEINPIHPVILGESKSHFSHIRKEFQRYDLPVEEKKKPEVLVYSLKGLAVVDEQLKTLAEHMQSMRKQHTEFLLLLKSIDIKQALTWLEDAEKLAESVKAYDPGNWNQKNDLRLLPDLGVLKQTLENVLPKNPGTPIPENDLSRLYNEAFVASELYQELKDQVSRVQNQLVALEEQQKNQQQKLATSLNALKQVNLIAENNTTLDEIIAGDVDSLQTQIEKEQLNLSQTVKGIQSKKTKKSDTLCEAVRQQMENWLKEFASETARMKDEMSGMLREVDKIAHLEDSILQETKTLISSENEGPGVPTLSGAALESLEEEFRRVNGEWQRLVIAHPKLVQIFKPVADGYAEVQLSKQATTTIINQFATDMDIRRTTSFQRLEREYFDLEHELERLKANRYRGLYLASRLKEFSNQYQDITERIKHLTKQVANHQEKVNTLSAEIQSLLAQWRARLAECGDNPLARKEIEQVINEAQTGFQQIQSSYKQAGELSQQQIYLLNTTSRRMREKLVTIGNQQWVNVDGNVSGNV